MKVRTLEVGANVISIYNILQRFRNTLRWIGIILIIFNLLHSAQAQKVRYVSASGTGTGTGLKPTDAMSLSNLISYLGNGSNFTGGHVDSIFFLAGNYTFPGSLTIANSNGSRGVFYFAKASGETGKVTFNGNGAPIKLLHSANEGSSKGARYYFTFKGITVTGFKPANGKSLIRVNAYSTVNLDNVIIENCTSSGNSYIVAFLNSGNTAQAHRLNIKSTTIRNNKGFRSLFASSRDPDNNSLNISYNSIYGNTFTGSLMNVTEGLAKIYNNTFSGNELSGSSKDMIFDSGLHASSILFINNTVYNSGGLNVYGTSGNSAKTQIVNNIVWNEKHSSINGMSGNATNYNAVTLQNNIFNVGTTLNFWPSRGARTAIDTAEFNNVFNRVLDVIAEPDIPGRQYHKLSNLGTMYGWDIHSGSFLDVYGFSDDQRGLLRPKPAALGAYDADYFKLNSFTHTFYYIYTPSALHDTVFDISALLKSRMWTGDVIVSDIVEEASSIGHITWDASNRDALLFKLTPGTSQAQAEAANGKVLNFKLKIQQGTSPVYNTSCKILMFNRENYSVLNNSLPGYIAPAGYSCFDYMTTVKFTSRYIFRTNDGPNSSGKTGADNSATGSGTSTHRVAWSTNTLIADLNGDGFPEITALCLYTTTDSESDGGGYGGIHIYNGQNGRLIKRLEFKNNDGAGSNMRFDHRGYHSATPFALIDSDRDGTVEMIMAMPARDRGINDEKYRSKLISYKIEYVGGSEVYRLTENPKWERGTTRQKDRIELQYNRNSDNTSNVYFHKGIPQICDFDGDGEPEVLIYNKIYSAVTGELLLEIEDIGKSTIEHERWGGSGNSNDLKHPKAYMGVSRLASGGWYAADNRIPFASVYDMDGDGVYDVVAGGKIYHIEREAPNSAANKKLKLKGGKPTYAGTATNPVGTEATAKDIGDGFTAVADIDGDGLPDVIVVNSGNGDMVGGEPDVNLNLVITVWNQSKGIIAKRTMKNGNRDRQGSNSYVFVGDIDGLEQNGRRLPEIAVLTGNIDRTPTHFPRHPNIIAQYGSPNGGIPASPAYTNGGNSDGNNTEMGCIFALTYDLTAGLSYTDRLKGSFIMEHDDSSQNTGFTMFDFDNDGIQEICYRDVNYIRIIKPNVSYVVRTWTNSTNPNTILFREICHSATGFEYPVIADIDNDGSAEIVVPGENTGNRGTYYSFVFAVGSNGDKFAPALPVWNQYMYDPFKIEVDSLPARLFTRKGPAPNRLSHAFQFTHEVKDNNGKVIRTIENLNPFNGNLLQASYIHGGNLPQYSPIVYLPEVFIRPADYADENQRPVVQTISGKEYIIFTIGNRSTSKVSVTATYPVAIYRNYISHTTRYKPTATTDHIPLGNLLDMSLSTPAALGSNFLLSPGQIKRVGVLRRSITGSSSSDAFIIRLGDDSEYTSSTGTGTWRFGINHEGEFYAGPYNMGVGVSSFALRDCDWSDQVVKASKWNVFDDFYTVQEFKEIEMDIFENDLLPQSPANSLNFPGFRLSDANIVEPPKAGFLTFNNKPGNANRVTYHHRDSVPLTFGVDSFKYRISFTNEENNGVRNPTAWAYIYVIRSANAGFVSCNPATPVEIADLPNGVRFEWFKDHASVNSIFEGAKFTATLTGDTTFWIAPDMSRTAWGISKNADFKRGMVTISYLPPNTVQSMRWTGHRSSRWRDPENWEIAATEGGRKFWSPARYAPSPCVDVIIPANVDHYPELSDSASCRNIRFLNRAMLKNPHVLKYSGASVKFRLAPAERDRFVMWSAPLKDMYSGDYRFGSASDGDMFMKFFQQSNPDYPSKKAAVSKRFTATFGELGQPLELGRGFNLRLESNSRNRDSVFHFPKTNTTYLNKNNRPVNLSRANGAKLITDGKSLNDNVAKMFRLPITGLNDSLILAVNPYMAYLNMNQFIANNDVLDPGYYIWNGELNQGFTAVKPLESDSNRFVVTNPDQAFTHVTIANSATYIAPLQSFIVVKKTTETATIDEVNMSPEWTTTAIGRKSYALRSDASPSGVLYIKVSQGSSEAYAAMVNSRTASGFLDSEDMPAIAYDELPLTLYTFTVNKEALAINSSSYFDILPVNLGIRAKNAGETKLSFTGLATFGYRAVELEDRALDRKVDLTKNPEYTFVISKSGAGAIEINDRFALKFRKATDTEETGFSKIRVQGEKNVINIQANSPINKVSIYDMAGKLVHNSSDINDFKFRLTVEGRQAYIVKVETIETTETGKVIAK